MSFEVVATNCTYNRNSWRLKRRLRSQWIPNRYYCWFIIGAILSLDYYASTVNILKAMSFLIPNGYPLRKTKDYRSNNVVLKRSFEPCPTFKKCGVAVVTNEDLTIKTENGDNDGNNDENKSKEQYNVAADGQLTMNKDVLTFGASISYTSDPSPLPSATKDDDGAKMLTRFFQQNHGILLRGGQDEGVYPIQKLSISSSRDQRLIHRWNKQCKAVNAQLPDLEGGDYVASVETAGVLLSGIEILPTSIVGVKILPTGAQRETVGGDCKEAATAMPEFQGVLISNEQRAKGPRPFVWLFDKIVHGAKKTGDGDEKTTSFVRVWVEPINEGFVFRATTFLEIRIHYPRVLSKLLPVGKSAAEKLCGEAIRKTLEKNLLPAMDQFHRTYSKWVTDKQN